MRTLIVDNHDSYTYNLFQLAARAYGVEPVVMPNDDPGWGELDLGRFDALIVSPGPGRPQQHRDVGVTLDLVRDSGLPTLGVCLGHQALAWMSDAEVVPAPAPVHGQVEEIRHCGRDLFRGLPQGFHAVRYHSLCVATPVPDDLEVTAWTADAVVMGLRHRRMPWWGVQFHPESISTDFGPTLLSNFRDLAAEYNATARPGRSARNGSTPRMGTSPRWSLEVERISGVPDAEDVFTELFADEPYSFWLDSSRVEPGLSRFSFLGDAGGPHGETLCCRPGSGGVVVRAGGRERTVSSSIFDVLDAHLAARAVPSDPALPFDLNGGYVGYLGYELKRDCGAPAAYVSSLPDATWMSATRFVAIDHEAGEAWALALTDRGRENREAARAWVSSAADVCRRRGLRARPAPQPGPEFDPEPWLVRPRERYLADIEECLRLLRAGESYEICLTNSAEIPFDGSPYELYLAQRRLNPAPYAAYLRLGETHVLCTSPERFLKVDRERMAESKPIKGTAPRAPEPRLDTALREELAASDKTRAENLMIVDLLRNDLGRISDIGTVSVPSFMAVESYETVHQLVSTVRGHLREGVTAVRAARTCFPGGSMTGAPKLRTMEIIDRLEGRARGVYSGAIGFFGLGGTADLNIVIRTMVARPGHLSVGAGGAIVLDSDPAAEYEEMLLKARAPLRALAALDSGGLDRGGLVFSGVDPGARSPGPGRVRG
ncbi:aminodeoxychorismate synthase component I [Actinomadura decatromicini]|uniref:aminodeoxychorismate synthase n=1 Tax=Actinomadura decatromicini TaxID=2604572 RepID=A0A5D3F6U9_9ACTN|nr:aminodeoxychorismate synthase component I [Actinomadura decatromicini]TYK44031.1 aminodeoxychorismate synthase component I [Actinomadura decatromicini]